MARKRADFKENSMASRINSGDSNDLNSNCIRIDPRTWEKFSFNVDMVAATTWQHPQQSTFIHARSFMNTFHPMGGVLVFCTVHYFIVDQWNWSLLNLFKVPSRAEVVRSRCPPLLTMTTFWVPVCISYSDVIYTHALLTYCEASRKACSISELRSLLFIKNTLPRHFPVKLTQSETLTKYWSIFYVFCNSPADMWLNRALFGKSAKLGTGM